MTIYNREDYRTVLPQLEKQMNARFDGLLDFFYPVGTYYETSDVDFDPNKSWGGEWELELEGMVHVSAGENYKVDHATKNDAKDGGDETVPLEIANMPSHNHGQASLSGTVGSIFGGGQATKANGICTLAYSSGRQYQVDDTSTNGWYYLTVNATHTHTSQGSGTAHKNMQPYIIVNRWHRKA